jgi:hypothetical protein
MGYVYGPPKSKYRLGGIMHLKPTAGCQISTLIFGFGGTVYISHEKLLKHGKVLCHLGLTSKVFMGYV